MKAKKDAYLYVIWDVFAFLCEVLDYVLAGSSLSELLASLLLEPSQISQSIVSFEHKTYRSR